MIDLWCFSSSKTCIIPATKDFTEEFVDEMRLTTQAVNTEVPCKGAFMVLSFHVMSPDEIRCYIYLNGQFVRFQPDDIKYMLPQFFKQNEQNLTFSQSNKIDMMIKDMNGKLIDTKFSIWYKENSMHDKA